MSRKEALSQFINQIHGRPVVVKLNSGVDYRGKKFLFEKHNPLSITTEYFFSRTHQVFWPVLMVTWTLPSIKRKNMPTVNWKTNTATRSSVATMCCTFQRRREESEWIRNKISISFLVTESWVFILPICCDEQRPIYWIRFPEHRSISDHGVQIFVENWTAI